MMFAGQRQTRARVRSECLMANEEERARRNCSLANLAVEFVRSLQRASSVYELPDCETRDSSGISFIVRELFESVAEEGRKRQTCSFVALLLH